MPNYYLDVETTGLDPKKDKILTIQFQKMDSRTGEPIGPLEILKEWESSEEGILKKFIEKSRILESTWNFIPVGYGLNFDFLFIQERLKQYGLQEIRFFNLPYIDLKHSVVIGKDGTFLGSGLDKFSSKKYSGKYAADRYLEKDYAAILKYLETEANGFFELYQKIKLAISEVIKTKIPAL